MHCHCSIDLPRSRTAKIEVNRTGGRQQYACEIRTGTEAGRHAKQLEVRETRSCEHSREIGRSLDCGWQCDPMKTQRVLPVRPNKGFNRK